jgi:hypothetical protein
MVSKRKVTVYDELERMWKEAVMTFLRLRNTAIVSLKLRYEGGIS